MQLDRPWHWENHKTVVVLIEAIDTLEFVIKD